MTEIKQVMMSEDRTRRAEIFSKNEQPINDEYLSKYLQ